MELNKAVGCLEDEQLNCKQVAWLTVQY